MAQLIKNPPAMQKTRVQSLGWVDSPGGGHVNLLQYSHLENPHGKRSLTGCSPWGHEEFDMTERLSTAHTVGFWEGENSNASVKSTIFTYLNLIITFYS